MIRRATGLRIHPQKTNIVPIVSEAGFEDVVSQSRRWLRREAPLLPDVSLEARVRRIATAGIATQLAARLYHSAALSVLGCVAQLEIPLEDCA